MTDPLQQQSHQLEIGQVIYCVASETGALYPVQVTEEVVHKSISGTKKTYTVRLDTFAEDSSVTTQLLQLETIGDQWFPTLETAKRYLIDKFEAIVSNLVENAEKLSMLSFGASQTPAESANNSPRSASDQDRAIHNQPKKKPTVTMPDGTKIDLEIDV